jgi:hypothetical protein
MRAGEIKHYLNTLLYCYLIISTDQLVLWESFISDTMLTVHITRGYTSGLQVLMSHIDVILSSYYHSDLNYNQD